MHPLNRRLQETFLFSSADLRANRSGRLSTRQQARLRAAAGGQRLAIAVFVVVLAGSAAILAFSLLAARSTANPNPGAGLGQLAIIAAVVGGVILIGLLISRPYLTAPAPKKMIMAQGPAQIGKVQPDAHRYEIKIGAAALRLATEEHLAAFQPGVEYRLFYLPGPVTLVLSGEVIGTEAEADVDAGDEQASPEQDVVVRLQKRARPVLIVLAVLALGIPLVGLLAGSLPPALRWALMGALLLAAIGFVFWALRRISK